MRMRHGICGLLAAVGMLLVRRVLPGLTEPTFARNTTDFLLGPLAGF